MLPLNPCMSLIHLLLKFPILTISLGIITAVLLIKNKNPEQIQEIITQIDTSSIVKELSDSTFNEFLRIGKVESGITIVNDSNFDPFEIFSGISVKEKNIGRHPDGVSYGPAGLTKNALVPILNEKKVDVDYILSDASLSTSYAYIYFLGLIHKYKDIKLAIIAYNFGPTRVSKFLKENKELPQEYYNKVMNAN